VKLSAEGAPIEAGSGQKASRKVRLRTLADIDRRTTAARAAIDLRDSIINDLGGADAVSAMKRAVIDNAATLGAMLEDMAASYLAGEGADLALYATLANAQRRLLADLGLERRARDITPSLADYVKGKAPA
jgi:hypothetical protein